MKTVRIALVLAACAALSACKSGETAPDPAASDEAFDGINSGKWAVNSRMSTMDQAQADAVGAERVQELMNEERNADMCLDYSDRSHPPVSMFYPTNEACSYGNFSMANGRINATLKCQSDRGDPTRLSGSYDKKSFTVTITKQIPNDAGGEPGERTFSTSGRFKGNC